MPNWVFQLRHPRNAARSHLVVTLGLFLLHTCPFVCPIRLGSIVAARASRLAIYIFSFYHAYTIPFLNSSSGYFVPRHTMPSFHSVKNIDRSSV